MSSGTPSRSTSGATPTPISDRRRRAPLILGAHLARRDDVMFRHLFERLPDIEAEGEPDRLLSPFINGIEHLDCRFTPVASD